MIVMQRESQHLTMKVHGDLWDNEKILGAFRASLVAARASILRIEHHSFVPQGLTAVALLAESHASIHTYPELEEAFVDYFSCAENPRVEDFVNMWREFGFDITSRQVQFR